MSASDWIAIAAAVLSAVVALYPLFHQSILTYEVESFVFTGKLFGEPKYGKDAIAQIIRLKNRSSRSLAQVALKSKSVGAVLHCDVQDNVFISNSDIEIKDNPDLAEWRLTLGLLRPKAVVSLAVLSNGLMRSHLLTGGNENTVLMHEAEFRYRRKRSLFVFGIGVAAIAAVWTVWTFLINV